MICALYVTLIKCLPHLFRVAINLAGKQLSGLSIYKDYKCLLHLVCVVTNLAGKQGVVMKIVGPSCVVVHIHHSSAVMNIVDPRCVLMHIQPSNVVVHIIGSSCVVFHIPSVV